MFRDPRIFRKVREAGEAELVVQDAASYQKLLEAKDRMEAIGRKVLPRVFQRYPKWLIAPTSLYSL